MGQQGETVLDESSRKPQERRVIDFVAEGIPDVVALGRYEYHSVKPGLSVHRHDDAIEICYLVRGRQTYRLRGREYRLVGGDIFVAPPGAPHDSGGRPEDCGVLYWLILRVPEREASILGLCPRDSSALRSRLLGIPRLHFAGRPALKQMFDHLFNLHDASADELKPCAVRHQVLSCLLEVLHCAIHDQRRQHSSDIEKVLRMVLASPGEEFSLADLAEEAGLSLSRFKVKFKVETGITPREFILRTKIDEAKRALLQRDFSVTDTAMQLGFSSSQYFATVFKRFTQQSPKQYRECASVLAEAEF